MMLTGGGGSTIALSLLSLVAGTFLLVKTCKEEMCCRWFPKIVAYVVIVISIVLLVCAGYWKIAGWSHHGWGYGHGKHMKMKDMTPEQMQDMMKKCPMMQKMQEEATEEME